jgi:CelD/BcsL family acetyltransferase involved in cellulose biosynthesis
MGIISRRSRSVLLLTIRRIQDESEFLALQPVWNTLLKSSGSDTIFLTFEWVSTWWHVFKGGNELLVLLVCDGSELIGIVPLFKAKSPFRKIEILGSPIADYQDFIVVQKREESIATIFRFLDEEVRDWDFLELARIPCDSPNHEFLVAEVARRNRNFKYEKYKIAPYLRVEASWNEYYRGLKGHFRRNLQMRLRRLESLGYQVKKCQTDDEIAEFMDRFFEYKTGQYKRKGSANPLRNRLVKEFYIRVSKQFQRTNILDCSYLEADGAMRAVHFGFIYGGKFYSYLAAFDNQYHPYGVGRILQLHLLKRTFEEGLQEFDFLVGGETYKFDWTPSARMLCRLYGFKRNLRGEMQRYWLWHVKPTLLSLMPTKMIRQTKRSLVAIQAVINNLKHRV